MQFTGARMRSMDDLSCFIYLARCVMHEPGCSNSHQ